VAEGDTILRAARRIEAAIGGEQVGVRAPNPRGQAAGVAELDGAELEHVEAHGKHLLLRFGERVLHSHIGMSGSWHVYQRGERWRKPAHAAWAVLEGSRAEAVQFGGPTLRVIGAGALRRDPVLARLGPDVLASDFDAKAVAASLRAAADRSLGDALLDQALVAGIGNIFKSEACFAAKVDPWQPIAELPDDLMREAVEDGRRPRSVYRRAGQPCLTCGESIAARGQGDANRITYWCPSCQSAPSAR
jgi:endonuclease VIII